MSPLLLKPPSLSKCASAQTHCAQPSGEATHSGLNKRSVAPAGAREHEQDERRQRASDLGDRMQRILDRAAPGPVAIIGTDIPGITPAHIEHAFRVLGRSQCVFGRAPDGGYWLVGARRRPHTPRPFANVRWSSERTLADTLANLADQSVGFVATLSDVDDAAGPGARLP